MISGRGGMVYRAYIWRHERANSNLLLLGYPYSIFILVFTVVPSILRPFVDVVDR